MKMSSWARRRSSPRNADIVAEQGMSLLMIPKEIYMRYWYVPHSPLELKEILADEFGMGV